MDHPSSQSSINTQKPYLIRALHEWCSDNGLTPHITVFVDARVQVPMQYVREQEIVLNISWQSTHGLKIDNDYISFTARFSGVAQDIFIPISHVLNIYARETAQGMAFPYIEPVEGTSQGAADPAPAKDGASAAKPHRPPSSSSSPSKRPIFTIVK